jgi:hypothetical protein
MKERENSSSKKLAVRPAATGLALAGVVGAAMLLYPSRASANDYIQIQESYPGAMCSTANGQASSGGPLHFDGPELWNQTNDTLWVECPITNSNYIDGDNVYFAEIGFRNESGQGSSSEVTCNLVMTEENGSRWVTAPQSVNNFTSYWEDAWSENVDCCKTSVPASISLDCQMGAGSVISMYRIGGYIEVDGQDL